MTTLNTLDVPYNLLLYKILGVVMYLFLYVTNRLQNYWIKSDALWQKVAIYAPGKALDYFDFYSWVH